MMPNQNTGGYPPQKLKFQNTNAQPGDTCIIAGTLAFARLASKKSAAEMKDVNDRRRQYNLSELPPFCEATVNNASIQLKDPNNPTEFEKFIQSQMFQSRKTSSWGFTGQTKGDKMPTILHVQPDGSYRQIKLEKEIANGTRVRIFMRCFKSTPNNGYAMNAVIIDDQEFEYFESGLDTDLARYGIIVKTNPANPETIDNGEAAANMGIPSKQTVPKGPENTQAPTGATAMNPPEPSPNPPSYDGEYSGLPFSPEEEGNIDYGQAYGNNGAPVYQNNTYTPPVYQNTGGNSGIHMP